MRSTGLGYERKIQMQSVNVEQLPTFEKMMDRAIKKGWNIEHAKTTLLEILENNESWEVKVYGLFYYGFITSSQRSRAMGEV
jgi:hypothetical protein